MFTVVAVRVDGLAVDSLLALPGLLALRMTHAGSLRPVRECSRGLAFNRLVAIAAGVHLLRWAWHFPDGCFVLFLQCLRLSEDVLWPGQGTSHDSEHLTEKFSQHRS